jgi:hypothetical protein
LRSAKKLYVQRLDLGMIRRLDESTRIAQNFLEATVSTRLGHFKLSYANVEEEVLLKALSRWAPHLLSLKLSHIRLDSARKGWSAVLRTFPMISKLRHLVLWSLSEQHGTGQELNPVFVSLERHIDRNETTRNPDLGVLDCLGRSEVLSGLEKLVAEPLTYEDRHGTYIGYRNSDDHRFRS